MVTALVALSQCGCIQMLSTQRHTHQCCGHCSWSIELLHKAKDLVSGTPVLDTIVQQQMPQA